MLSGVRLEYTEEELALIADSQRPDEEGMRKWARVNDFSGRSYAMAGLNKEKDDFTVPAGFPLSRFWSSDFHPRWIRTRFSRSSRRGMRRVVRLRESQGIPRPPEWLPCQAL